MSDVLGEFTTKVVNIKAVQVEDKNLYDVAELCGGTVGFDIVGTENRLFVNLKTDMGSQKLFVGMWLVQYEDGRWMGLRDDNFRRKFVPVEPANPWETVDLLRNIYATPPYDR